jgi:hypothetical protein
MTATYITTTIPYVNARPHLGFALELVQADVLARHYRTTGERVRLQAGTDDNSLKNVLAAQATGVGVQEFVDANAAAFTGLRGPRRPVPQALRGPLLLDTLAARSFLASAYRAAGDLATAAPLHQLNLTDTERVLGANHPETLVARANLAYLYALQHRENDALELHERNLADYERVQGPDHPTR